MIKKTTLILLFITYKVVVAQSYELVNNNDTINFVDANSKKQGKWIIFNRTLHKPDYTDDQKVEEGRFTDSKKTGLWKEFFPNNNVKSKITYENNRPSGYAIMYHENGKIKEEGLWKNNRWVGDYKLYYENGQVQQDFKFNATGKREGPQVYYYENGQKMIEGDWAEGKEAGLLKEYYENGDIKAEKNFNGGMLDLASTKTYEPKKAIAPAPAKKEEIAAPPIIVDKVKEKDNLGKPFNGEGYWKLYNANKQVSKDGTFSKNRLVDGKVYYYSPDGILTRIAVYKDGKYVGDSVIDE